MRLQDHCLLISDMQSNAGAAMVHAFAAAGAHVAFGGKDAERGHKLQELLEATGANTLFVEVDPCNESSVQSFISDAIMTFGRLDGVVINHTLKPEPTTLEDALQADLLAAQYAAPFLSASPHGSVVLVGQGGISANTLKQQTEGLAAHWAPQGIRTNSILAGAMLSSIDGDSTDHIVDAIESIPMSRLGTPDDIVQPCGFLLSTDSSYITGTVLHCDGGASLN